MTLTTLPKVRKFEKHKIQPGKDRTPITFDISTDALWRTEFRLPNEIKIEATKA